MRAEGGRVRVVRAADVADVGGHLFFPSFLGVFGGDFSMRWERGCMVRVLLEGDDAGGVIWVS